ncbi:hypothetical protein ACOSQ3_015164 [Xanthoceras sorbifolium]
MSSSKDVSAPAPESSLVPNLELPQLRKRLISEVNDPRMVLKGKLKASPGCLNARKPKMSRTLESVPELVLPLSFVPPSSGDALAPPSADVPNLRVSFIVEDDSEESIEEGLVGSIS